jgi:hypothetical protein
MKAQLVKRQDRFDLYNKSDGSKIASTSPNPMGKLSLKNCQTIENGYDLDELAKEEAKKRHDWNMHRDTDIYNELVRDDAALIKIGFQKAVELLGDKKFSEEDMRKAINWSWRKTDREEHILITDEKDFIQSLQQTEWDVFFNPDEKDSDGCLILQRQDEK